MVNQTVNLQEIFNLNDRSGCGEVPVEALGTLLRSAGLNPTDQVCAQISKDLSRLTLNFEDFSRVYEENSNEVMEFRAISGEESEAVKGTQGAMIAAIRTFDHQGTGFISLNELKFILTGLGEKLSDDEFEDLRQFMELSPSGQVSYERKK